MRRGCLFGSMFWGILLVVFGILLILNIVFRIPLQVGKILLALLFFYLGLRLLLGSSFRRRRVVTVLEDRQVENARPGDKYDIVFGRGDIDLTRTVLSDRTVPVELNTVFGASVVTISAQTPIRIVASSAFGSVRLPDGNVTAFGEYTWNSPNCDETRPHILFRVASVFGSVRINYS